MFSAKMRGCSSISMMNWKRLSSITVSRKKKRKNAHNKKALISSLRLTIIACLRITTTIEAKSTRMAAWSAEAATNTSPQSQSTQRSS